ncbi:MAG: L-aspartate oxidase [Mycobacterium leprae]
MDRTEILIIGSGLAGVYAALEALEAGAGSVTIATAGRLEESNSDQAQGGVAAALGADDEPGLHALDTLVAGAGLCHEGAVAVLTREGPERVEHLAALGVPFCPDFGLEGGHSRRRVRHTPGSQTGHGIMTVLLSHLRRVSPDRLQILEQAELVELVTVEGRCYGAWFRQGGRLRRVGAKATLLATGGAGGLFPFTTNPPAATGSGIAAAYLAGAAVADMEFLQFHPTGFPRADGGCTLISEAVRGEGAYLVNAAGERFMPGLHPRAELAPRDIVSRAVIGEMERSGGPVFLSLRHLPTETVHAKFPYLAAVCRADGLDMARDPIPVRPAAHYLCGGVWTDLDGRSTLPGLWVAGEASCTGIQGANRLASNSLLECLVFGRRAAQDMVREAATAAEQPPVMQPAPYPVSLSAADWQRLRAMVSRHLGPARDAQGLQTLLAWLETRPAALPYVCVRLMAEGALQRVENRGCHYRKDGTPAGELALRLFQQSGQPGCWVAANANP